jgi:hypothetical protein
VGGCLFYPSAGQDTDLPINAFVPWIREFWFVDANYNLNRRFDKARQLEEERHEVLTGTTLRTGEGFEIMVRHERYRWSAEAGVVTIHRCRGRGYDVFRQVFAIPGRKVAAFFHRGDSHGEGGSNFYWLGRQRLPNVLNCLEPGGIVVSDGSNAMRAFRRRLDDGIPPSFEAGTRKFDCVGYLGDRNGPTLVWKTRSHLINPATE